MFRKLIKAIKDPARAFSILASRFEDKKVRQVSINGEIFFEYRGIRYPERLARGNAKEWIEEKAKKYCRGRGTDVGADQWPLEGAIPVRNETDQNAYKLDKFEDSSLDYVFSSHCLEHLDRWYEALELWVRKLKTGGILFLYLPHESMKLWRPGAPWVADGHVWIPKHEILIPFLKGCGLSIVEYNPAKDDMWSFHIVAKKN
jgi:SAM-dependent methyltransferase